MEGLVCLDLPIPIALPHDLEMVAVVLEKGMFLERVLVHFLKRAIGIEIAVSVPITGMTRASMPQTAVELVHGLAGRIVTAHQDVCHLLLATIAGMTNVVCTRLMISRRRRCSSHASHLKALADWLDRAPCQPQGSLETMVLGVSSFLHQNQLHKEATV